VNRRGDRLGKMKSFERVQYGIQAVRALLHFGELLEKSSAQLRLGFKTRVHLLQGFLTPAQLYELGYQGALELILRLYRLQRFHFMTSKKAAERLLPNCAAL
jgi:hypothetical protein